MAYKGQQRIVSCSQGGLTGATNVDSIQPYMMIYPSRNLLLEKGGRRKRGGTAHVNAAAYSGTPRIMGIHDCIFRDLSQYVVVATDDGDVYKNDTDTIATGLGTTLPYSMVMGEDKLFIADGVNEPQVWTGTGNAAEIAAPAADWATAPPFQFLKHGRGASQRMCALNATTLYLSATFAAAGDMEKFVTGAESFYIDTGDGYGLVGMVEIGKEVVVFGKNKAYRIDDSSLIVSEWGWVPVQWDGGVASWRLIIKTPNDIVCMADDGEIYSLRAVADYGDYKLASLTRESWLYDWIKANVDMSYVSHFHGVYDPSIRAIVIWVVRTGYTAAETALVYFIDRPPAEAWMVHDNQAYASGYNASASAVIRDTTLKTYSVYTGDYVGEIWQLNKADRNDNSNGYYAGFRTANDAFDNPRASKHYNGMRLIVQPEGTYFLQCKVWVDGVIKKTGTVSLSGYGVVLGTFILGTDYLSGGDLIDNEMSLGYVGKRIQYEVYNANADEDFFISGYMTDHKIMGAQRG